MTGATEAARGVPRALLGGLLAAALAAAAPAAAAGGESDARALLDRMAHAARNLDYVGTFVYHDGDGMDTMQIIHRAGVDGERERLVALTGAPREVIRDREHVTCILPDTESVVVSKSRARSVLPTGIPRPDADVGRYYRLSARSGERIAGRETQVVLVEPRDRYRYAYRLWLDRETGLLLRSELLDEGRAPLEQVVYTSISFPEEIPDSMLEPGISGEGFRWYTSSDGKESAQGKGEMEWQVGWLPSGFEMSASDKEPIPSSSPMPVEQYAYGDGFGTFSVFIEKLRPGGERLEGASRMGAVHAFGRMVGAYQVTVVGEVPGVTVKRVAQSVSHQ